MIDHPCSVRLLRPKMIIITLLYIISNIMSDSTRTIPEHGVSPSASPPRYIINLDLTPGERWRDLIIRYKSKCLVAHRSIEELLTNIPLGTTIQGLATWLVTAADYANSVLHRDELQCIADILEQPFEKVVLAQLIYEMCACCTSAVFQYNGNATHYRTMDWGMDFLRDLTVELDFQRKGKTVFLAVSWVGYIGIMTGMLPEKYSIALNFRTSNCNILGNVRRALTMSWPVGYLFRHVLESEYSCDMAVDTFKTAYLVSPCYITICSVDIAKSCVIVRDPNDLITVRPFNSACIQANVDDIDTVTPADNILYSRERCRMAQTIITNIIPKCHKLDDIFKAFDKNPITNDLTIYRVIMIPGLGTFRSLL